MVFKTEKIVCQPVLMCFLPVVQRAPFGSSAAPRHFMFWSYSTATWALSVGMLLQSPSDKTGFYFNKINSER